MKVLDHGSIELLDFMGSDSMILETARVSTGAVDDAKRNKGLMHYLIRNDHITPLESCVFRFKVKAPIFVARQWFRHRMSSYNEKSMRYTEAKDIDFMLPEWRQESNVRGMTEDMDACIAYESTYLLEGAYIDIADHYSNLLELGVAKEHARTVMPMGTYTEWIWTVNLSSLYHFIKLRTSPHAQKEIRVYAEAIVSLLEETGEFDHAINSIMGMVALDAEVKRLLNEIKDPRIGAEVLSNLIDSM